MSYLELQVKAEKEEVEGCECESNIDFHHFSHFPPLSPPTRKRTPPPLS